MANISRNTFRPGKNYVAVRMQQGVPLVDADWNEMNDITRHELYKGLNIAFSNGVEPGSFSGYVLPELRYSGLLNNSYLELADNDFYVVPGQALIQGRPLDFFKTASPPWSVAPPLYMLDSIIHFPYDQQTLRVDNWQQLTYTWACRPYFIRYSNQFWKRNPTLGEKYGVEWIPDLTTPTSDRTDIVYLDMWEREVDSTEDANLINEAIGIETCARSKRDFAIRVAEGRTTLPAPPDHHHFMPLALLERKTGEDSIKWEDIRDIRPQLHRTSGERELSFCPAFLRVGVWPLFGNYYKPYRAWKLVHFPNIFACNLLFPPEEETIDDGEDYQFHGILPLALPDGADIKILKIRGTVTSGGEVEFRLLRLLHHLYPASSESPDEVEEFIEHQAIVQRKTDFPEGVFSISIPRQERKNIVDNSRYYYVLYAIAYGGFNNASIYGISIHYS
jgi:hypothetical protein